MSHVIHTNEQCRTHVHAWMSHVTHMHTYETSRSEHSVYCLSDVRGTNESLYAHDRVMPHVWMSHATDMNESCHAYDWVMPHVRMSHVTQMQPPVVRMACTACVTLKVLMCKRYTYQRVNLHVCMSHVANAPEARGYCCGTVCGMRDVTHISVYAWSRSGSV